MAILKTIIHAPTGEFRNDTGLFECGPFEPQTPTISDYAIIVVPTMPDPRTQKWNGSTIVAKTAQEIAAFDRVEKMARFTRTSREKDFLATCARIVRDKNTALWTIMTMQQKKVAVLAEADTWVTLRQFVEDNL